MLALGMPDKFKLLALLSYLIGVHM